MGKLNKVAQRAQPYWLLVVGVVVATGLLTYRLGSLTLGGKLAVVETAASPAGSTITTLLLQPAYLPLSLARWVGLHLLPNHPAVALRAPEVLLALTAILACVYVARRWYGKRTAIFGFIILSCSAWFLHVGRLATNDALYLTALPLLLTAHLLLTQPKPSQITLLRVLWWLLVALFLLYIPGLVWFVVLEAVWQRKLLLQAWRAMRSWYGRIGLVLLVMVGVAPLVYDLVRQTSLSVVLTWLGLPTSLPTILAVVKNAAAAALFLVWRTPADPARWLGTLALLGSFLLLCLVAGILFYAQHLSAERTRLLASLGLLTFIMLAVGGPVPRSLFVPLIYMVALGGLAYILHLWLLVFPNNPVMRWAGIGLVSIAVALSCTYNLRHYFVAWPLSPATKQTFVH